MLASHHYLLAALVSIDVPVQPKEERKAWALRSALENDMVADMFVDVFEDSMAAAVDCMGDKSDSDVWQTSFEEAFQDAARSLPSTGARAQ